MLKTLNAKLYTGMTWPLNCSTFATRIQQIEIFKM